MPHARSAHVTVPSLGFGACAAGVDFGAPDGPAHLVFLIAAPDGGGAEHLNILAALARRLVHASFRQALLDAPDAASGGRHRQQGGAGQMKFVAVTSCPTGIAHTYMAAEALEQAGKAAGHEVQVETQGAAGSTPLDPAIIAAADGVIFAADLEVRDKERFAGKPMVDVGVKRAVHDAHGHAGRGRAAAAAGPPAETTRRGTRCAGWARAGDQGRGTGPLGTKMRQWLMTGVAT